MTLINVRLGDGANPEMFTTAIIGRAANLEVTVHRMKDGQGEPQPTTFEIEGHLFAHQTDALKAAFKSANQHWQLDWPGNMIRGDFRVLSWSYEDHKGVEAAPCRLTLCADAGAADYIWGAD